MRTFLKPLLCFSFLLLLAGQAKSADFVRLFQCDGPSSSNLKDVGALEVQRSTDLKDFRQPRLLLRFKNDSKQVFTITSASWFYFPNPLSPSDVVVTRFNAQNTVPLQNPPSLQFEMRSNGAFQPLSGKLGGITFRTCGAQLTSTYYWTKSSMTSTDAFACPDLGKPAGCPGVGPN